jgi:hypothetical protein
MCCSLQEEEEGTCVQLGVHMLSKLYLLKMRKKLAGGG